MNDPEPRVPHQSQTVNSKRRAKTLEQTKEGFFGRIRKVAMGYKTRCWIWNGRPNSEGYGVVGWGGRNANRMYAHRFSWMKYKGDIPDGLWTLHKCDIRNCVNPRHLFLGTAQDNTDDMYRKGREVNMRGEGCGKSKMTEGEILKIRELGASGKLPRTEISKMFSVHLNTVCAIIHGDTWKDTGGYIVTKRKRWEATKLSKCDVIEIHRLFEIGTKQVEIAKAFGVHQSHISRIIRGEKRRLQNPTSVSE